MIPQPTPTVVLKLHINMTLEMRLPLYITVNNNNTYISHLGEVFINSTLPTLFVTTLSHAFAQHTPHQLGVDNVWMITQPVLVTIPYDTSLLFGMTNTSLQVDNYQAMLDMAAGTVLAEVCDVVFFPPL